MEASGQPGPFLSFEHYVQRTKFSGRLRISYIHRLMINSFVVKGGTFNWRVANVGFWIGGPRESLHIGIIYVV